MLVLKAVNCLLILVQECNTANLPLPVFVVYRLCCT